MQMKRKQSEGENLKRSSSSKKLLLKLPSVENLLKREHPVENEVAGTKRRKISDRGVGKQGENLESTEERELKKLLIYDYDNTLFPTSFISYMKKRQGVRTCEKLSLPEKPTNYMKDLDTSLITLLEKSLSLSEKCIIITNGTMHWVKVSTKYFLPNLHHFLFTEKRIEVISARDDHVKLTPCGIEWKKRAFKPVIDNFFEEQLVEDLIASKPNDCLKSVVSVGDGLPEEVATRIVCKEKKGCFYKSVKLQGTHNCTNLLLRLNMLEEGLEGFLNSQETKDFKLVSSV